MVIYKRQPVRLRMEGLNEAQIRVALGTSVGNVSWLTDVLRPSPLWVHHPLSGDSYIVQDWRKPDKASR